jgi:hypothetical protein
MSVTQNSYTETLTVGTPGMVANGEASNRISRSVEDSAGIAFGKAAFRGVSDRGCTATPTAGTFLGVVIADPAVGLNASGVFTDVVPQRASAAIETQGAIWVTAGVDVADGEDAYVTSAGVFTNVPTSNVALTGWKFDDTVLANAVVRIAKR